MIILFLIYFVFTSFCEQDQKIVTFLNGPYKELLFNFVCNLEKLGLDRNLHVFLADYSLVDYLKKKKISYEVIKDIVYYNRSSSYSEKNYWYISKQKTRAFEKAGKIFKSFLFSDVDVLFLRNPINYLQKHCLTDICFQSDSKRGNKFVNSGFFYVKKTQKTDIFFEKASNLLNHSKFKKLGDQDIINFLLKSPEFKSIYSYLDRNEFPNGSNNTLWKNEINTLLQQNPTIYVIHNNWIKSKKSKIERLRKISAWYANGEKCDF